MLTGEVPARRAAAGRHPGRRHADDPPAPDRRQVEVVERLTPWAEAHGHTTAELAIAWLLAIPKSRPSSSGRGTRSSLAENVKAAEWTLTPAERDEVAALAQE